MDSAVARFIFVWGSKASAISSMEVQYNRIDRTAHLKTQLIYLLL